MARHGRSMLRRLRNRTPLNPILSPTIIEEFESLRLRFSEDIDKVAALVGGNGGMEISPLPQSVYDDIANPAITSVSVPRGRYTLSGEYDFYISRSNLDLDFNGSTIVLPPLFQYPFYVFSVLDRFVDPSARFRDASHLTGTITTGTTQLTMDADEIMDVVPGEIVMIVAGINTSDPVEPAKYIVAEVLSVSGQVITFTAPLGANIAVYANEAALQAAVTPGLWFKIGPWGEDTTGNYKKGLGTDHGLLRYVGGMVHDITFRNFHVEMTIPSADAEITIGKHVFFMKDVLRPSILNWSTTNAVGPSLVHTWRCDDVKVDGLTITGEGRSKIFEPDFSHTGAVMSAWGGKNITYQNVFVHGKNINLANTEVSPENVLFKNLTYEVEFDKTWTYTSQGCLFNFAGHTLGFGARFENSTFDVTGPITDWDWDPGSVVTLKDCVLVQPTFGDYFDFSRHIIEGTITVGGIVYGPFVSDTKTLVRTGGVNGKRITFPKGFYKSARFRVTTQGSCNDLADGFGYFHNATLSSGNWEQLTQGSWLVAPPTSIAAYLAQRWFSFNWSGSSSCTCEFEIEYYPATNNPGWVMD